MRQSLVQSVVLFVGLTIAAAILMVLAPTLGDTYARTVMLAVAAALFGSGLTTFLVRMTSLAAPHA
ncbi:MAG: hypothetical protein ACM3N4_07670 [Nitrososphaerota archaeon]